MNDPPDQTAEFKAAEFVVGVRNDCTPILFEQFFVFFQAQNLYL